MVRTSSSFISPHCRTLSEFWHWFVANIPGDSVDDGEVIFELLFPLVLPEGDGDHRYVQKYVYKYELFMRDDMEL